MELLDAFDWKLKKIDLLQRQLFHDKARCFEAWFLFFYGADVLFNFLCGENKAGLCVSNNGFNIG